MKIELTDTNIIIAVVLIFILIFAVFVGIYLASLDTSGEMFTLTVTTIHNDVYIYLYNPLLVGQTVVNTGSTPIQLPRGNYSIKAELYRDYSEPIVWTKSFTLDRDLEVKLFED